MKSLRELTSNENVLNVFHSCLCGGSFGFEYINIGFHGDITYEDARSLVREERGDEYVICLEDVYTKGLEMGATLYFKDADGEYETFNLDTLKNNILDVSFDRLVKVISDQDYDSIDTDCILQELIYGEVVFG
jgi:hypothetical protein